MNDHTQAMLTSAEQLMRNALRQTRSRPAGTRVLLALLAVMARQFLTVDQQQQVSTIEALFEECVARDGESKS
jgi:hypothetical protein